MSKVKNEDIRIDVFRLDNGGLHVACRGSFVKVEHIPSGIVITEFGRSQLVSKNKCIERIEELLEMGELG